MRLIDERKKKSTELLYINKKKYKNIAWTDFLNVNIALTLHSYEEN